jgi:transcriptional regulator GlxA family with amidase domain
MQTGEVKTIVFLVYPGLTALDLIGPLQVFSPANHTPGSGFRVVAAGERLEPMATDTPVQITPDVLLSDVPNPFGVIVPGGGLDTLRAMANRTLTDYLTAVAPSAEFVGSVCTGALILAAAGLLEGRKATTHWAHYLTLEQLGATYLPQRWVEDGKFITSAGVSAGIDMALHLIGRLAGMDSARQVQLGLEYEPEPPFGPIAWSLVDRKRSGEAMLVQARAMHASNPELAARLSAHSLVTDEA